MVDDTGTFVYTVYHLLVGLFYLNWQLNCCQNLKVAFYNGWLSLSSFIYVDNTCISMTHFFSLYIHMCIYEG